MKSSLGKSSTGCFPFWYGCLYVTLSAPPLPSALGGGERFSWDRCLSRNTIASLLTSSTNLRIYFVQRHLLLLTGYSRLALLHK